MCCEGAFPAGLLLLDTRHYLVEGEVGVDEVVAEIVGGGTYVGSCHIVAEDLIGLLGKSLGHSSVVCGLLDNDRVNGEVLEVEVGLEIDVGIFLGELGYGGGIVAGGDVAHFGACHLLAGEFGLDGEYVVGEILCTGLVVADKTGESGEVCAVGCEYLVVAVGLDGVVVAVAETETALTPVHGVDVGVLKVGLYACAEEYVETGESGHEFYHFFAGSGGYELEVGLEGLDALLVEAYAVHAHGVEVGDFLSVRAGFGSSAVETENEFTHLFAVVFAKLVESAEAGIFGLEGVGFHPAAASIVVEVVAGVDACVEIGGVDAFGRLLSGARAGSETGCKHCADNEIDVAAHCF